MSILEIAALVYLFIYYGVIIGLRSFLLYKSTGINSITHREKSGIEGIVEKVLTISTIMISVIILNYVFLIDNYQWLLPVYYLENSYISYTGIAMSIVGFIIVIIAQMQMGNAWRLGPNKKETTHLIDRGLFSLSRNPIYLGIFMANLGLFLMLPNALSLVILTLSYVAIEIKIRLEEKYLIKTLGKEYIVYKETVSRWFFNQKRQ